MPQDENRGQRKEEGKTWPDRVEDEKWAVFKKKKTPEANWSERGGRLPCLLFS